MQIRTNRVLAVAAATALVVTVSACSSSSKSTSKSSDSAGGASASTSSSGGGSAGVQAAQAFIKPYLQAPTTLGVKDKLSKNPGAGKKVVFITCEQPICTDFYTGFKAAASQFSWSASELVAAGTDIGSNNKQMLQAVALKPDAIVITGGNVVTWQQGLDAAKSANIPVFGTSGESHPLGASTGLYSMTPINLQDRTIAGQLMGNWIVADSNGKANVLEVDVPELKIPNAPYSATVAGVLDERCAGACKHSLLNVSFADVLGGKAPGAIVSYLQSHPKVQYVSMTGGFETGVAAAIKQAGIQGVKIVDASTSKEVETEVKNGEMAAALGFNALMIGWYAVNAVARHLAGDAPGDAATASIPTQVLLKDNIGTPENYLEPSDYQKQFRTLWGLS